MRRLLFVGTLLVLSLGSAHAQAAAASATPTVTPLAPQ